ncbi:MAG TPA: nucleotide exchange factor GrpE [Solirubrobacteraceae bacterium]|jgi:molecular chaperone GrpE
MTETEQVAPQPAEPTSPDVSASGEQAGTSLPDAGGESEGGGGSPEAAAAEPATDGAGTESQEDEQILEGDVAELLAAVAKRDEYLALAQRTQADFENYRKRVARDSAAAQERGVAKLARELLPALDNLDRALEAAAEEDPLLEGVRLVRSELAAALGRVGIESFSPGGEQFDPEQHEAIVQRPVEGAERGSVAEVYQPGYRLNGTIIRPARVVVAA